MSRASLVDGMAVTDNVGPLERLTVCSCWRVKFNKYALSPVVVVPIDTSLDEIEALARRSVYDTLVKSITSEVVLRTTVATMRVEQVERLQSVVMHPGLA